MTYLSCLKLVENSINLKTEIRQLELQNNVILPPIFKSFVENYDTNLVDGALLPYFSDKHPFLCDFSGGNEIPAHEMIYKIFTLSEMFENLISVYPKDDEIWVMGLLPFAECPLQGYLMVGIGKKNQDQIFIEYAHSETRIEKVGDNIVSFLNNIRISPEINRLPNGASFANLYKNWGEDFWRIRPNEADKT